MGTVLSAREDGRGTRDALVMALGIWFLQGLKLVENAVEIGRWVTFSKKVGKEMRERRRAERRA